MNKIDINFFRENGYFIIDNAFSLDDINYFRQALREVIYQNIEKENIYLSINGADSLENECDKGLLALRLKNPEYAQLVQAAISRSPEYFRLCSSPIIVSVMRTLLGLPQFSPLYLTNNGIIFTNPNDELNKLSSNINIDWHKDTFFTIPKSHYLHLWAPVLHNATKEIGTLMVCQGSHKNGIGDQRIHPQAPYDHRYSINMEEVSEYPQKSIELKLGQALIFDSRLIHRSGINSSKHVRCTLIGLYHDVSNANFSPLTVEYRYAKQTPEGYFYELFKDEKAIPLLNEQALNRVLPTAARDVNVFS